MIDLNDKQIEATTNEVVKALIEKLVKDKVEQTVERIVQQKLLNVDIEFNIAEAVRLELAHKVRYLHFPDGSIPARSVNFNNFTLPAEKIAGGIFTHFSSSGIDDKATDCKLTILDDYVVIENELVTNNANVKGNLTIEGNMIVKGDLHTSSESFSWIVAEAAKKAVSNLTFDITNYLSGTLINTINTNELKIGGNVMLTANHIGPTVVTSNLQTVGELKELSVRGEASLGSGTFYVSPQRRVGINTFEPSGAFAVRDEEAEVIICKLQKDTGYVGTHASQNVVLGAARRTNITLTPQGETLVQNIQIGETLIRSANNIPIAIGRNGEIVLNGAPAPGQPIGWVCIQGIWHGFGKVEPRT